MSPPPLFVTCVTVFMYGAYQGGTGRKASSMSSLNSLTMGIDGPSWRSTMCSTTTIPEEPENDVVPETPHEPGIWKVTSLRLTLFSHVLTVPGIDHGEAPRRIYVFARQHVWKEGESHPVWRSTSVTDLFLGRLMRTNVRPSQLEAKSASLRSVEAGVACLASIYCAQ